MLLRRCVRVRVGLGFVCFVLFLYVSECDARVLDRLRNGKFLKTSIFFMYAYAFLCW